MNKVRVIGVLLGLILSLFLVAVVTMVARLCAYLAAPRILNEAAADHLLSSSVFAFIDSNTYIDASGNVFELYVRPSFWSVSLTADAWWKALVITILGALVLMVANTLLRALISLVYSEADSEDFWDECGNGACQCTGHGAQWFNPDSKTWEHICRNPYCKCDDHYEDTFSKSRNMWVYEDDVEPDDVLNVAQPHQSTT